MESEEKDEAYLDRERKEMRRGYAGKEDRGSRKEELGLS